MVGGAGGRPSLARRLPDRRGSRGRGLSPGAAVGRPRLHFDGETLHVEGSLDGEERRAFERAGFGVRVWERRDAFFGGVQVVARGRGGVEGAGDPRRGGLCVTV